MVLKGTKDSTGGITGILYLNDSAYTGEQFVKVVNATNNGNIEGVNTYTGGIVGRTLGSCYIEITNCTNNAKVTANGVLVFTESYPMQNPSFSRIFLSFPGAPVTVKA